MFRVQFLPQLLPTSAHTIQLFREDDRKSNNMLSTRRHTDGTLSLLNPVMLAPDPSLLSHALSCQPDTAPGRQADLWSRSIVPRPKAGVFKSRRLLQEINHWCRLQS